MMVQRMSDAWRLAWDYVSKAQKKQKAQNDRYARPAEFDVGDRVFVLMPAARSGPANKLVQPFHGPFRVIATDTNVVEVRLWTVPRLLFSVCPGVVCNDVLQRYLTLLG